MIDELEKAFAGVGAGATAIVGFLLECSGRFSVGSTIMNRMFLWLVPPMTSLSYHRSSRVPNGSMRSFSSISRVANRKMRSGACIGNSSALIKSAIPVDDNWTGAEIRSCCRLAALLDVSLAQAAQNVVPVAATSGEAIDRLRQWASGVVWMLKRAVSIKLPLERLQLPLNLVAG